MRTLLVASSNPGKVREFGEIFGVLGWECESLKDYPPGAEPEETGLSFVENACIKARAYAGRHGEYTLADDSGLEVDAIGGGPGVHSAYWAHHNGGPRMPDREPRDAANCAFLLRQLDGVAEGARGARFVCVLALADPTGKVVVTARGTVEGEIVRSPRGAGGFGYDPLFLVRGLGKTTAELSAGEKHAVSHRGEATRRMVGLMGGVGVGKMLQG